MIPLFVSCAYAVIGALWIAGSDFLVYILAGGAQAQLALQTYKGWLFILVTAVLLYAVLRAAWGRVVQAHDELQQSQDRLELALSSAGGGIWDRDLTAGRIYISAQLKSVIGFGPELPDTLDAWRQRVHPEDWERLRRSTRDAIRAGGAAIHDVRYRVRRKDGSYAWLQSRGRVICDREGEPVRMPGVAMDVTEQVEAQERVRHLTHYDPLTGLANRSTFRDQLERMLPGCENAEEMVMVLRVDIDSFKEVNSEFGSACGDRVLQEVAHRSRNLVGAKGVVARMGADEFAAAVRGLTTSVEAHRVAKLLAERLEAPVAVNGARVQLSVSIGAAIYPGDGEDTDTLLANADITLSRSQKSGGGQAHFYEPGMDEAFRHRARRAQQLRTAASGNELEVHYQPVVDLAHGRTLGFEALVRWRRPDEGLVPPGEFIGLAEDLGVIRDIGRVVLREACRAACDWRGNGNGMPYVAVNVSPRQLDDPGLVDDVRAVLAETGLTPAGLELEVTENALANDPEAANQRLEHLRELGVSIAIDDFGTGFSSLGALGRMPVSKLKIDKSFIARYGTHNDATVIVDSVLGLARNLQLSVTAEGIETHDQLGLLRRKAAHAAQGYLFSKPVEITEVAKLLDRQWFDA